MMVKWYSLNSPIMVKMWSAKCLIIVSLCFCTCYGQELLNSSEFSNDGDYFGNSTNTYFTNAGNINRIVGGRNLTIVEVPHQVAILSGGKLICGGSVISANWILTAAHCITRGTKIQIRAGSRFFRRGGTIRNVRYVVVNSGYNNINKTHDIALIKLSRRLKWSAKVRPIRLAKPNFKIPQNFLVSGWGAVKENVKNPSNVLRGVRISKVPIKKCKKQYVNEFRVSSLVVCAALPGKDSCSGDSGGPLINNGVQYGIVSGGKGCARPNFPGIYTNIKRQYPWIRNVVRRFGGAIPIGF